MPLNPGIRSAHQRIMWKLATHHRIPQLGYPRQAAQLVQAPGDQVCRCDGMRRPDNFRSVHPDHTQPRQDCACPPAHPAIGQRQQPRGTAPLRLSDASCPGQKRGERLHRGAMPRSDRARLPGRRAARGRERRAAIHSFEGTGKSARAAARHYCHGPVGTW